MAEGNPFKLQSDNKKFFTSLPNMTAQLDVIPQFTAYENGLNRIKNMNRQLQELAKKRQEMLFKDAQIDFIFKKQKPNISLGDFITGVPQGSQKDKKFRVRALLKEKKQTIHEFLEKKKQIYLSKMNINIKKQQTVKLSDYIKDEEETLKARKLYFDNDVEFMHKFIQGIKKQADEAQSAVENQLKTQQGLVSKLNALEAQNQKLDNLISKDTQTLNNLKTYKEFIDSFQDPQRNWKHWRNNKKDISELLVSFLTEHLQGKKPIQKTEEDGLYVHFQPENLIEIFANAEENNIREIQNLHDKQDQLETIMKNQKSEQQNFEKIIKQNQQKIADLIKKYQTKQAECSKLKELRKNNNSNKLNILDNENLDLQKVSGRIFEIYKQIEGKKQNQEMGDKTIKKAMTIIEHQIEKLRQNILQLKNQYPTLISQIQKEIKQNQKKQNIIRKQQEAKLLEEKKQKEQEKKRSEQHNEKMRGRKDMKKVLIQKKVKQKKEVDVKVDDDVEKYLGDDN